MKRTFFTLLLVGCIFFPFFVHASSEDGTIDPQNTGNFVATFLTVPNFSSNALKINMGKFTTQSAYNIHVRDSGIRGYVWGALSGWIVMNCLDTTSGCSSTNGNFAVAVSGSGVLSGYAWGQGTGWINFGPFPTTNTSQVKINASGLWGGSTGNAGYAWSQNFGWIIFDCSDSATCVKTDFIPSDSRQSTPTTGSYPVHSSSQTTSSICSDGKDNDSDGWVDYPSDRGCESYADTDETDPVLQPDPEPIPDETLSPQPETPPLGPPPSETPAPLPSKLPPLSQHYHRTYGIIGNIIPSEVREVVSDIGNNIKHSVAELVKKIPPPVKAAARVWWLPLLVICIAAVEIIKKIL